MEKIILAYVIDGYAIITLGKCNNLINEKTSFRFSFDKKGRLNIISEQCLKI
jgi:hypothetical protein